MTYNSRLANLQADLQVPQVPPIYIVGDMHKVLVQTVRRSFPTTSKGRWTQCLPGSRSIRGCGLFSPIFSHVSFPSSGMHHSGNCRSSYVCRRGLLWFCCLLAFCFPLLFPISMLNPSQGPPPVLELVPQAPKEPKI